MICSFLLSLSEETQTHSALYDTLWTKVSIYNISLMLLQGTHLKEPHCRLNISSVYRDVLPDVRSKAPRTQYICALGAWYDPGLLSPPHLNVIALPAPLSLLSLYGIGKKRFSSIIFYDQSHICVQSHDCYQHWQSVCLSTILEPIIACCCFKLLSHLQQFEKIFWLP